MPPKRKRLLHRDQALVSVNEDLGTVSLTDSESETDGHDAPNVLQLHNDDGSEALLGLDFSLNEFSGAIRKLIQDPVSDDTPFCHLRDLPGNAIWSDSNTLSVPAPKVRAIVLVAFGSLAGFEMVVVRGKAATLSVAVELFGDAEVKKLQQILDWVKPGQLATREVIAVRVSAGARSRLLNVYDRSGRAQPKHKQVPLGVNELVGGDVVRLEMRCVRVKDGAAHRVEFKLKSLSLFVPMRRSVDIMQ